MTLRNNNKLVSEFPTKNIYMSITDVNTATGPVLYLNKAFGVILCTKLYRSIFKMTSFKSLVIHYCIVRKK